MTDTQAKAVSMRVLEWGDTLVERQRQEILSHLDFWKPQLGDPITVRLFDRALSVLEEMVVLWLLQVNEVKKYRYLNCDWAVFPVVRSQVRANILEYVGLKEPAPTLADIMAVQPMAEPQTPHPMTKYRAALLDLLPPEPKGPQ